MGRVWSRGARWAALVLGVVLAAPLWAQADVEPRMDIIEDILSEREFDGGSGPASEDLMFPDLPTGFMPDEDTRAAMQEAVAAYYGYRAQALEHRSRVFEWQHLSTQIIFFAVIGIVLIGLYFSWIQFHADQHRKGKDGEERAAGPVTTLETSLQGIKVSSPVLGVIILVLSLAFFYLYLTHVYPITEVS